MRIAFAAITIVIVCAFSVSARATDFHYGEYDFWRALAQEQNAPIELYDGPNVVGTISFQEGKPVINDGQGGKLLGTPGQIVPLCKGDYCSLNPNGVLQGMQIKKTVEPRAGIVLVAVRTFNNIGLEYDAPKGSCVGISKALVLGPSDRARGCRIMAFRAKTPKRVTFLPGGWRLRGSAPKLHIRPFTRENR